jgi:hypothetical protein
MLFDESSSHNLLFDNVAGIKRLNKSLSILVFFQHANYTKMKICFTCHNFTKRNLNLRIIITKSKLKKHIPISLHIHTA